MLLLLLGQFAVYLDFRFSRTVEQLIHAVERSILRDQRPDLELKSWS